MLSRFTQIDYDREIALVAIDENSKVERMHSVARAIGDPDSLDGGIAVVIGDARQGKGIGAVLMQKWLLLAEKRVFNISMALS